MGNGPYRHTWVNRTALIPSYSAGSRQVQPAVSRRVWIFCRGSASGNTQSMADLFGAHAVAYLGRSSALLVAVVTLVAAESTMRTLFIAPLVVDPPLLVMCSARRTKLTE